MSNLGKWPTMRVVGQPVDEDTASEILLATAPWWGMLTRGSAWVRQVRQIAEEFGMPVEPLRPHTSVQTEHDAYLSDLFRRWMPDFEAWCNQYGVLYAASADGIANDRITTTYRAWCDWDGLIAGEFNIGKYPSEQEVHEQFVWVARRFPRLDMVVDLIAEDARGRGDASHEEGYTQAVRIVVKGGAASMNDAFEGEPLRLPAEFYEREAKGWQCIFLGAGHRRADKADRMSEQGVSADRLRRAFATLTRH